jgi:hypothetical protein
MEMQVVEALRYKPEGQEFDSSWGHWAESTQGRFGPRVDSASNRNEYRSISCG